MNGIGTLLLLSHSISQKKSHMAKTSINGVGKIIRTGRHCKSDSDGWGSVILHKSERLETKLFFVFPCEETGIASQKLPKQGLNSLKIHLLR